MNDDFRHVILLFDEYTLWENLVVSNVGSYHSSPLVDNGRWKMKDGYDTREEECQECDCMERKRLVKLVVQRE